MAKNDMAIKKSADKKSVRLPSKATMNFARRKSGFNIKKMLPIILIIIVVAALFVKLAILDQLSKKIDAYTELSVKQAELAAINARLSDYDQVAAQYGKYSYGWMTDAEKNTVDCMQTLKIIESTIMPASTVNDFSLSNNVLTLNLSGITLELASSIVKALEQNELVDSASVYSASSQEGEEAEVFMSVVLTNGKEAEE